MTTKPTKPTTSAAPSTTSAAPPAVDDRALERRVADLEPMVAQLVDELTAYYRDPAPATSSSGAGRVVSYTRHDAYTGDQRGTGLVVGQDDDGLIVVDLPAPVTGAREVTDDTGG